MKKRIIKVSAVLVIVLMTTVLLIRFFFSSIDTLSYKIFYAKTDGYYIHKLFGVVPRSYQNRYIETILDSYDDKDLLNLVDQRSTMYSNFILLRTNKNSEIYFLKAYPFSLVGVKDEMIKSSGWIKHVSLLIDLKVFNDYVSGKHLSSKEETIKKYCDFISDPIDSSSHKILKNRASLDSLINEKPLLNIDLVKSTGGKLINLQDIDFDQSSETLIYCWIYNKGVVKFIFTVNNDNTLKSVDSEIIGFLGNEVPSVP